MVSPFEGRLAAWQFTSPDESEVLVFVFRRYAEANAPQEYVKIMDVDENAVYQDDNGNKIHGAVLRHVGVKAVFPDAWGEEAASFMVHLTKVK